MPVTFTVFDFQDPAAVPLPFVKPFATCPEQAAQEAKDRSDARDKRQCD